MKTKNHITAERPLSSAIKALKEIYGPDFSIQNITDWHKINIGKSGADVYYLNTDKGAFIIKPETAQKAGFSDFLRKIETSLSNAGVHIPPPIINIQREDGSSLYVQHCIDGELVDHLNPARTAGLARSLADCHRVLLELLADQPDLKDNPHFVEHRFENRKFTSKDKIEHAARYVAACATSSHPSHIAEHVTRYIGRQKSPKGNIRNGFLHTDLKLDNIIFTGNEVTIIDWEHMGYGPLVADITNALVRTIFAPAAARNDTNVSQQANQFLSAYDERFPLTADEVAAIPGMLREQIANRLGPVGDAFRRNRSIENYIEQTNFAELLGVSQDKTRSTGPAASHRASGNVGAEPASR